MDGQVVVRDAVTGLGGGEGGVSPPPSPPRKMQRKADDNDGDDTETETGHHQRDTMAVTADNAEAVVPSTVAVTGQFMPWEEFQLQMQQGQQQWQQRNESIQQQNESMKKMSSEWGWVHPDLQGSQAGGTGQ